MRWNQVSGGVRYSETICILRRFATAEPMGKAAAARIPKGSGL